MKHTFSHFKEESIIHPMALRIRQSDDTMEYYNDRLCIADRLLGASAALSSEEFLGFQVLFARPMPETFTVFSSAGVLATGEDYGWLFCR